MMDRRRIDEIRARQALQARQPSEGDLARLYRTVFGTPEGEKVLADICFRLCGIDHAMYDANASVMAWRAIRRDLGEQIAHLALDPIIDEKPEVQT